MALFSHGSLVPIVRRQCCHRTSPRATSSPLLPRASLTQRRHERAVSELQGIRSRRACVPLECARDAMDSLQISYRVLTSCVYRLRPHRSVRCLGHSGPTCSNKGTLDSIAEMHVTQP